jgi:alanine racemase
MSMKAPYQGWVEIDLDALDQNIATLKQHSGGARIAAVVKANAYGHGALAIAQASMQAGADRVCTYNLDEAAELRAFGFQDPILVLGQIFPDDAARAVDLNVALTISQSETAAAVAAEAKRRGRRVPVHVKVEAGLNRLGLPRDTAADFADAVRRTEGLALEGFYTHFPSADGPLPEDGLSPSDTEQRFERFLTIARETDAPILHAANTASLLRFPSMALDMVRIGVGLYGISPGAEADSAFSADALGLAPVLTWKAMLIRVHDVAAGESVSYGATWMAERDSRVGVVAVGYADGFRRALSNRGSMLVRGMRVPVVGTICMDMCMVDLTDLAGADVGDEATLVGVDGAERTTLEDVAVLCDTIPHEMSTAIGDRPARVYLRGGQPVAVQTKLDQQPIPTTAPTPRAAVVAAGGR